jgi:predicted phosphoribosyltransferase
MTALKRLGQAADSVIAAIADPTFEAVGAYYETFSQTEDEEVIDLLRAEHVQH